MSLAKLAKISGALIAAAFLAAGLVTAGAVQQIRIGGPLYDRISQDKDLVSDLLPPPLYLVEAYLEATLAQNASAEDLATRKAHLATLREDFARRQQYWKDGALSEDLRRLLSGPVESQGALFWSEVDNELIPALEAKDAVKAAGAHAKLEKIYQAQRAAVETAVNAASAEVSLEEQRASTANILFFSVFAGFLLLSVLFSLAATVVLQRRILQPLKWITFVIQAISKGDTQYTASEANRADEVGELARAYQDLRQIVIDADAARERGKRQDEAIAAERARVEREKATADKQRVDAMCGMVERVEHESRSAVGQLTEQMSQMMQTSSSMAHASNNLTEKTELVSTAAKDALDSMRSAATSTKELSTSIDHVEGQVRNAKSTTDEAVTAAARANAAIDTLSRVVIEINNVTEMIAQISRQTGLLALNAGVEAARAGDQGRGFAVIASEVRDLAAQTSSSTQLIGDLINQVQQSTQGAVNAVADMSGAIHRVSQASDEITSSIQHQVAMTKRIANDVSGTTASVTNVTQQARSAADEMLNSQGLANNLQQVCANAAERVNILQTTLVKIVRTSSDVVNRREHPRYGVDKPATVDVHGHLKPVQISDLSLGGARIFGDVSDRATNLNLRLPGVATEIAAHILENQDGVLRVEFKLSPQDHEKLKKFISTLTEKSDPISGEISVLEAA